MFSKGDAYIHYFTTRKTCQLTRFLIQQINFGIAFPIEKWDQKSEES